MFYVVKTTELANGSVYEQQDVLQCFLILGDIQTER